MTLRPFRIGGGFGALGGLGRASKPVQPLRFAAANNRFPTGTSISVAVASAATTRTMLRDIFHIGSGDCSQLVFSFMACSLVPSTGWTAAAGGYSIVSAAFEYNGTSVPILFSGGRTKTINSGDTDIQSDALLPAAFSLSSFSRGSTGFVRLMLEFTAPATMKMPTNRTRVETQVLYDATKVNVTNGVDSTGAIAYSMINGGVNGTDAVFVNNYLMPIILGRFVSGDPAVWLFSGDSKTEGQGDTETAMKNRGMCRALYPNPASATNCIAGCNFGCSGGVATEWAAGTPAYATPYFAYANYGLEAYGTNAVVLASSQAIHATFRAKNYKKIVRLSLTPRAASTGAAFCPIPISSLTSVGTTATATVASTANLTSGQSYPISGAAPAAYNGTFAIGNLTATTFDYTFAGGTSPATGTIRADDQFRTEAFQVATTNWSVGGAVDTFEQQLAALVAADYTYIETSAVRGSTHWKWVVNGTVNFVTADGLHETAVGYELRVGGTGVVTTNVGSSAGSIRSYVASLP